MTRISILVLLAVLFASCNPSKPDVECAGYEGSLLWEQYFPYQKGDVLTFLDSKGNSYALQVGDIYETEHKFIPHNKFLSDQDQQVSCETPSRRITSEHYYSYSQPEKKFKIEHVIQTLYGSSRQWEVNFQGLGHHLDDINNEFYLSKSYGTQLHSSIVLNNKEYKDVISDSESASDPITGAKSSSVIYIAKGVGIVGSIVYSSTHSSKDTILYWLNE